jgi:hypothetical protein
MPETSFRAFKAILSDDTTSSMKSYLRELDQLLVRVESGETIVSKKPRAKRCRISTCN